METESGPATLLQGTDSSFTLHGAGKSVEGQRSAGWVAAAMDRGSVQAVVWRFWEQYPKAFTLRDEGLEIGLFAPGPGIDRYRPRYGEAKRHDLLLTFALAMEPSPTQEAVASSFQHAPRLFDRGWFCRSGALVLLDPGWFENQPRLAEWVRKVYGDAGPEKALFSLGIRDYGDRRYGYVSDSDWAGTWFSDYCAQIEGALRWGLVSGRSQWLERSTEMARHIQDVDLAHLRRGDPQWEEWGGATMALGLDHSVHGLHGQWSAYQAGEGLIANWWMTGDPDSREAALANADWILRKPVGTEGLSARNQTRPLWVLRRAWEATGNRKYLEGARRYVRFLAREVLDWRRGAYTNPPLGRNHAALFAGLESDLGSQLYAYYRMTGDLEAAQMAAAIADSVICDSMVPYPEGLGDFLYFPRYARNSWYNAIFSLFFCQAYDLTGDLEFLRASRAAFDRYLLCHYGYQEFGNWGWLEPELGAWFSDLKDVETPPFAVTSEVATPDPTHFRHAFQE